MKKVKSIVFRYITAADFFNINKPSGTEIGGGGQSYIDFPTDSICYSFRHRRHPVLKILIVTFNSDWQKYVSMALKVDARAKANFFADKMPNYYRFPMINASSPKIVLNTYKNHPMDYSHYSKHCLWSAIFMTAQESFIQTFYITSVQKPFSRRAKVIIYNGFVDRNAFGNLE